MKKLKLYEIIEIFEKEDNDSILIKLLIPYKKSLLTYYSDYFCCEPILMITIVSNAVQYAIIVPSNEFNEALYTYVQSMCLDNKEEETTAEEVISFNSIMLSNL